MWNSWSKSDNFFQLILVKIKQLQKTFVYTIFIRWADHAAVSISATIKRTLSYPLEAVVSTKLSKNRSPHSPWNLSQSHSWCMQRIKRSMGTKKFYESLVVHLWQIRHSVESALKMLSQHSTKPIHISRNYTQAVTSLLRLYVQDRDIDQYLKLWDMRRPELIQCIIMSGIYIEVMCILVCNSFYECGFIRRSVEDVSRIFHLFDYWHHLIRHILPHTF